MKSLLSLLTMGLIACGCSIARGDMIIDFSTDGGLSFTQSVTVNPGDTVRFDIYARQNDNTNTLNSDGLLNMGTRATFNTNYGVVTATEVANTNFGFFPDASFDNDLGELFITAGASNFIPLVAPNILLGSVEFRATGPGVTSFQFGDFDPDESFSDMVAGDGADLDPIFFGETRARRHQMLVSVVPEPSCLAMCGILLGGILFRRRWSR